MFFHNYRYRLKCIVRDRQILFWTLLFPILLSTLFYLAFSNIANAGHFTNIKIAIVDNEEYRNHTSFIKAIESVSGPENGEDRQPLFDVQYVTLKEAEGLLMDNKIEGYLYLDNGINLFVKETGINQTIIKGFLDDFKQTTATVTTILKQNPNQDQSSLIMDISNRQDFMKEVPLGKADPDNTLIYFYASIAMACLYGSFWGLKEVADIQANQTCQGARISMTPVHKLKLFGTSMLAATTVQFGIILVFLSYLALVLKVSLGNQLGYILLTCGVGTITGVTFGTCLGAIIKKSEGIKIGILVVFTNIMSFLAGMMSDKIKYIVSTKAPVLAYLNPINLIADSFYSLYYYDSHTRFYLNIVLLWGFAGIFSMITYLVLRRQKYDSL